MPDPAEESAAPGGSFDDHTGGIVAWREAGTGDPVVFLHGLGGTRTSWGPQLRELSSSFRCIAWDMPGYGDSEPLTPLTFEGIADRLVGLLDTLDIARADLVGLSFGGMHALHCARRHPHRIGRLVLADTSPAFGMDGTNEQEWKRSRLHGLENGGSPADAAEAVVDAITARPLEGAIRDETVAAFGEISASGFRAAVACLPTNDVRAQLRSITHEALVLVGELDKETPVSYARALAEGLPSAELHILEGAGHLTPAETPRLFNRHVRNFLHSGQRENR